MHRCRLSCAVWAVKDVLKENISSCLYSLYTDSYCHVLYKLVSLRRADALVTTTPSTVDTADNVWTKRSDFITYKMTVPKNWI